MGIQLWDEIKELDTVSERQIRKITEPVLLVYGSEDRYITNQQMRKTYKKFKDPKNLYIVEGSPHVTVHDDHRQETLDQTLTWLKRWL